MTLSAIIFSLWLWSLVVGQHLVGGLLLDFDEHVFQTGRIFVEDFALIFSYHHGVGMAEAAPVGIVDARLAAESHALFQDRFVAFCDPRRFVALQADAVAGTMLAEVLEPSLAALVQAFLVEILAASARFHIFHSCIVRRHP